MKAKLDFVTNSSCASFVIMKKDITQLQQFLIHNHLEIVKEFAKSGEVSGCYYDDDSGWQITEDDETIEGSTSMDNFDMVWFLSMIGISDDDVKHEGC